MPSESEFYVGYLPIPGGLKRTMRRLVVALGVLAAAAAALLIAGQHPFPAAMFEFQQYREFHGTLLTEPYPALAIPGQGLPWLLVGPGKHGAGDLHQLNGREVRLKGERIFRGADHMIELAPGSLIAGGAAAATAAGHLAPDPLSRPLLTAGGAAAATAAGHLAPDPLSRLPLTADGAATATAAGHLAAAPFYRPPLTAGAAAAAAPTDLGQVELTGEIVDSKCYFGVMNPGNGKVHRDCAVRCISGGVPPAFLVRDAGGQTMTLLLGQGKRDLLDHIAEPITIRGRLQRSAGRLILYPE